MDQSRMLRLAGLLTEAKKTSSPRPEVALQAAVATFAIEYLKAKASSEDNYQDIVASFEDEYGDLGNEISDVVEKALRSAKASVKRDLKAFVSGK